MKKIAMGQVLILLTVSLASCKIGPEPIQYGSDACHYCSMTIVDKQHAAQFVTEKGRAYKFDAIECMVNHLNTVDASEVALFRVNAFEDPEESLDATKAVYLISRNIPSPMGEFLSAFGNREKAVQMQERHEGNLFTWPQLLAHFNNKTP